MKDSKNTVRVCYTNKKKSKEKQTIMAEVYDLSLLVQPALAWYEQNKRDLPWRRDRDPYHIWVSEIMLQQTRVEAVIPYYERFMSRLPTIQALAECEEDPLLKLWEGLGYYNRVRNMQKAAQILCDVYEGRMPDTYEEILALPGIGPYTAGAVASIAYGRRVPAVDGNVLRILSRVRQDDADIAKESTKRRVTEELSPIMPSESGNFNQALMEIGATVCIPNGQPRCSVCPWKMLCESCRYESYDRYPVKSKAKPRKIEDKTILLIQDGEKILLRKRPEKGLLAGLYELPNVEGHWDRQEVLSFVERQNLVPLYIELLPDAKHIFSHVEWKMKGYRIRVADTDSFCGGDLWHENREAYLLVEVEKIRKEFAVPSAFEKYAEFLSLRETK